MLKKLVVVAIFISLFSVSCVHKRPALTGKQMWVAMHFLNYNDDQQLAGLEKEITQLAEMGVNTVILEVDYHFEFQSHPELRQGEKQITLEGARNFAEICRKNGMRLIIEFQCLGRNPGQSKPSRF